ncbi:hypothetical protein [Treponema sp.]|uniref:hypothetical protein n=1 Tax=Treponema sp. TaxID=166 RepID=UPI003FD700AC
MDNKSVAFFILGVSFSRIKTAKTSLSASKWRQKKHKKTQSRTKKHTGRAFRGYGVYRTSGAAHLQATTTIANA